METLIHSEEKYKGKIISLWVGQARLEDGTIVDREILKHSGSVAIVPVFNDSLILVRQYRITIGRKLLELPAGRLSDKESPETCAHRELEEETGYRAGQMVRVASYYSSVGFLDEKIDIFLAFRLRRTEQKPDPDERIQVVKVPIGDIESKLLNNEFEDSKTIIGLREMLAYLEKK
jgi:ADP-ribose pyrophosphatase